MLLAVAAVVLLFLAGVAVQRQGAATGTPAQASPSPKAPPPLPGLGAKVRDGHFEFVVARVDCSRTTVGLEHLKRTAKGKYCVAVLSVRNFDDEPHYFVGRAQKAFDTKAISYGNDDLAGLYANRDTQTFLEKLDPGERVTGRLVFDVPKTVKLAALELHDSLLSGGVKVTV
ncbi:MAG TPA: DUF4352 domain-containing protein [Actinoplanes sp.]|nr:DUF4352 domain-containing protein [Actinoplanes sp.]